MSNGLDDVFGALSDPTRRSMVRHLIASGPTTATSLARELPITRQAVVKHLQALAAAGLVSSERDGREVNYAAHDDALAEAMRWLVDTGASWDRRLARLSRHLERR